MGIKFNFRGIEITASNAAEAAELLRQLTAQEDVAPPKRQKVKRAPPDDLPETGVNGFDVKRACRDFLTVISKAGRAGASAEDFVEALHISHPKGIGGRAAKINTMLRSLGFEPHDVYDNSRTAEGRFWRPKRRLPEALGVLDRLTAEGSSTG